jgi:hypothetical protein
MISKMETKNQPLLHPTVYRKRLLKEAVRACIILGFALLVGIAGYHFIAGLNWIDSIYNASMILGGMGPVNEISGALAKLFASMYAIFSGIVLIGVFGLLFTPVLHRIMHRLHLEN